MCSSTPASLCLSTSLRAEWRTGEKLHAVLEMCGLQGKATKGLKCLGPLHPLPDQLPYLYPWQHRILQRQNSISFPYASQLMQTHPCPERSCEWYFGSSTSQPQCDIEKKTKADVRKKQINPNTYEKILLQSSFTSFLMANPVMESINQNKNLGEKKPFAIWKKLLEI